jgi:hypothetical protein
MSEISIDEARKLAKAALERLSKEQDLGDLLIIDDAVIEAAHAWYFPYDAAAFILQGNVSSALAGNLPVKVSRDGAEVTYEASPTDNG